jgi:hypothetical protein
MPAYERDTLTTPAGDRVIYRDEAGDVIACRYFALCDRPAEGFVPNPVLGPVPCCARCAAVVGAVLADVDDPQGCRVCGALDPRAPRIPDCECCESERERLYA